MQAARCNCERTALIENLEDEEAWNWTGGWRSLEADWRMKNPRGENWRMKKHAGEDNEPTFFRGLDKTDSSKQSSRFLVRRSPAEPVGGASTESQTLEQDE